MAKSANLYVRIEPEVKEQAENILATLGIPASNAINMFYKQIILQQGLPFAVKIPVNKPLNIARLTDAQFTEELEQGYRDLQTNNVQSASKTFSELRKDYKL